MKPLFSRYDLATFSLAAMCLGVVPSDFARLISSGVGVGDRVLSDLLLEPSSALLASVFVTGVSVVPDL